MSESANRWRNAWRNHAFRNQSVWSIALLVILLFLLRLFLDEVEGRSGVMLDDPVLRLVSPFDLRWVIYALTYSGILLGLAAHCFHPLSLLLVIRASVVLIVLRGACLFLLPLDPPDGIIPLIDPIIQLPFSHAALTRDLFFSWETAVMSLLAFAAQGKDLRIVFSCGAVMISALLLIQHVHYTIDVVAAPCFAYAAYGIGKSVTVGGTV